jgi:site-specific DNA recombinase
MFACLKRKRRANKITSNFDYLPNISYNINKFNIMDAIILARVSTEEQKEAGNSLPAQIVRMENYCIKNNFRVVKKDSFDESAYKTKRDDFDKIIDCIKQSREKIIVCFDKVDRFSRNVFDKRVSCLYEMSMSDRIELHFTSDNLVINSKISAVEKFHFGMNLGLAKYFSDAISDNVKRAYESKLKRGEWPGKADFGYVNIQISENERDIIVDPTRASAVVKAYEMYAVGSSYRVIEAEMDRLGITSNTKNPRPLAVATLEHILSNPFYYGFMRFKGKLYPHKYPPLITKELFDKVQDAKKGYHKKPFQYGAKPFVFRGLIKCAECGCTITAETKKGYTYYSCTNSRKIHEKRIYVKEEELLEQISGMFKKLELPDSKIQKITEGLKSINESHKVFSRENNKSLRANFDKLENRINELTRMRLDKEVDSEFFDTNLRRLKDEQNNILSKMQILSDDEEDYCITVNTILSLAKRAQSIFESSEVTEKRQLLNFILQNCELRGKNIEYKLKTPFDTVLLASECSIVLPGSDSN